MSSKYLVKFYFVTLMLGVIVTTFVSLITDFSEVTSRLFSGDFTGFFSNLIWIIGYGLMIASVSQLAFFVYLFLHPLGMGLVGRLWPYIQLLLVFYAIFDLFFIRLDNLGTEFSTILSYAWVPLLVIIAGVLVAKWKNDTTDANVFIPSIFFMIFMTSITLIPFLNVEDVQWIYRSVFTLIICNAFQLMMLPKYIEDSKVDKRERGMMTKADRKAQEQRKKEETQERLKLKEERQIKTRKKLKYKNKTR